MTRCYNIDSVAATDLAEKSHKFCFLERYLDIIVSHIELTTIFTGTKVVRTTGFRIPKKKKTKFL